MSKLGTGTWRRWYWLLVAVMVLAAVSPFISQSLLVRSHRSHQQMKVNRRAPAPTTTAAAAVVGAVNQSSPIAVSPGAGAEVAITFDDGPSPMTPAYLQVLRQEGVKATFFNIGRNVQRYPQMTAMTAADGNEVGDHSFSHPNLKKLPVASIDYEIVSTANLIQSITQQRPIYFRPPGENFNGTVVNESDKLGMKMVLWNIDPRDWSKGATAQGIINHVITHLRPGSIILLHEGKPQTLAALPILIETLKKNGWKVVTVSELLSSKNLAPGVVWNIPVPAFAPPRQKNSAHRPLIPVRPPRPVSTAPVGSL